MEKLREIWKRTMTKKLIKAIKNRYKLEAEDTQDTPQNHMNTARVCKIPDNLGNQSLTPYTLTLSPFFYHVYLYHNVNLQHNRIQLSKKAVCKS